MLLKLKNEYGQPSISASVLFADRSWAWQALTGQEEQIIWLRGEEWWKYKMDLELQREAMEKERTAFAFIRDDTEEPIPTHADKTDADFFALLEKVDKEEAAAALSSARAARSHRP